LPTSKISRNRYPPEPSEEDITTSGVPSPAISTSVNSMYLLMESIVNAVTPPLEFFTNTSNILSLLNPPCRSNIRAATAPRLRATRSAAGPDLPRNRREIFWIAAVACNAARSSSRRSLNGGLATLNISMPILIDGADNT